MSKSFISRLSKDQIDNFLRWEFPNCKGYRTQYFIYPGMGLVSSAIYLMVTRENNAYQVDIRLEDFQTYGNVNECDWLRYLYKQFGDEYLEAYKEHAVRIFADM